MDTQSFSEQPSNYIFRGNSPNVQDPSTKKVTFAYDELRETIIAVAKNEAGVTLDDFYLLIVNFENSVQRML